MWNIKRLSFDFLSMCSIHIVLMLLLGEVGVLALQRLPVFSFAISRVGEDFLVELFLSHDPFTNLLLEILEKVFEVCFPENSIDKLCLHSSLQCLIVHKTGNEATDSFWNVTIFGELESTCLFSSPVAASSNCRLPSKTLSLLNDFVKGKNSTPVRSVAYKSSAMTWEYLPCTIIPIAL